ncbi:hypothetical protein niasHS_010577 [Heterodera schachtii]|uniref:G-protein coupled receptors family 1 profile domain-containing protein n=1 Tax=Heterodera schachtii TaxID=97005 RepID=A0ABD2IY45_HETSC
MNSSDDTSNLLPTANTKADPAYERFKDSGVSWELVALIGCKALVCLVGVVLNLTIVHVTVKTKTLRGACNVQIALNGLSTAIQECSAFVTFAIVVSGLNFIPLRICAFIQFLPLFCTIFTNGVSFSIGIDRLFSILFPIWYMARDKSRKYLFTIVALCAVYASIVPIVSLDISLRNPMIPVMCTVIDPVQKAAKWVVIMLLIVNSSAVCCYILVWLAIIARRNLIQKQEALNVFKSLSMILLLELFGWVANYTIRLGVEAADIHELTTWYVVNASTIAPYFSMSISPIILYTYSSEYRSAFLLQFPTKLTARICPQNSLIQKPIQIQRQLTEMTKRCIHSKIKHEHTQHHPHFS